jgi:hypothetical protein
VFTNQPNYLVRTTAATTVQSVSFLYADVTNSRLGINTTSPGRLLDVNGDVSFSSDLVYWDVTNGYYSLHAGNITTTAASIDAKPFPGHNTLINLTAPTQNYYQGTVLTSVLSDSAMSIGQLVYYRGGTGRWALTDANALSSADFLLGIVLDTVGAAGSTINVLLDGLYSTTFTDGITTVGDPVYISETQGNVTGAAPTTAASVVKGVGQTVGLNGTTYTINFRPDTSYFVNG